MHPLLITALATLAGAYFLIRNLTYLKNPDKLEQYLRTDPRGRFWSKKLGEERTLQLTKKYFLPLGIVMACILLFLGLRGLWYVVPSYL